MFEFLTNSDLAGKSVLDLPTLFLLKVVKYN